LVKKITFILYILLNFSLCTFGQSQRTQNLFPILVNSKYGYINSSGNIVIGTKYDSAGQFSDGLAAVEVNNKWGYIDETGRTVIKPQFAAASRFSEGLASVLIGNKSGYIDKTGQLSIPAKFLLANNFSEGLASVAVAAGYGFIDKTGRMVIPPRFDWAEDFSEGLASIRIGFKVGFIDKQGKIIITPQFSSLGNPSTFVDGLAPVGVYYGSSRQINYVKAGYVDKTGKLVIPPQFSSAYEFSEGLASVAIDGQNISRKNGSEKEKGKRWAYIDKTGEVILELGLDIEDAGGFVNGIAHIKLKDGRQGYIDKQGRYIWKPSR
jgi:hypothetical protein